MTHFKITQAGLISLCTTIVGLLVAFIPDLSPDKEILIAAGTAAVSTGFLIANAIHALVASRIQFRLSDLEAGVRQIVQSELGQVNLNGLVKDVVAGENIGQIVQNELKNILARAAGGVAPVAGTAGSAVAQAAPAAEAPPAA